MKIIFVSQPLSTGGAERVVAALSNQFCDMGHDVKIIVVDNGDQNTYYTYESIEIIHIAKPKNPLIDLLYRSYHIRMILNENNPDIVLPFTTQKNVSVLLAALCSKHKVIVSERNNPYLDPRNKVLRILRKLLYWSSEGFVFQTEDAKAFFSRTIQIRSCVIANPINSNLPSVIDGVRKKRIVMVNRLDPQKNIIMGIDAFISLANSYPEYSLEIFGKGPLEKEVRDYIHEKGMDERVFLRGFCNDVTSQIRDAEIFLMTSDYEGMSNSLMEALALGLVCISTDHPTGGARALINDHENGILFPVRDKEKCILAIKEVLDSKELRDKLSSNAIKIRQTHSISVIAKAWLDYIQKII